MRYPHDDPDDDDLENDQPPAPHRELTLGMGTLVAIFLGMAVLCGGFFAFGYNMGAKTRQAAAAADTTAGDTENAGSAAFDHFSKPSPGAPAIQPVPGYMSAKDAAAANNSAANTAYNTPGAPAAGSANYGTPPAASRSAAGLSAASPSGASNASSAALPAASPRNATTPLPYTPEADASRSNRAPAATLDTSTRAADSGTPGSFVVQVAAVSHQEDAELLQNALKRKGYTVNAHREPDNLTHIQIGPFASRKEAEAMRLRLQNDGYNAILK